MSLAVTEVKILENFTLQEVLEQLVSQQGPSGTTLAIDLYRQWWRTARESSLNQPGELSCDTLENNKPPTLNGFPFECPRQEGDLGDAVDFSDPLAEFVAIGLFNRFDLAPVNGDNCGEYRIVFGMPNLQRNFAIFEAVLPNPSPQLGLGGCRPVAEFWADLSNEPDLETRAKLLHEFYFVGLPGFLPVVHIDNYGADTTRHTGQVRTNQFLQGPWNLREFRVERTCANPSTGPCQLDMIPQTVKVNPFGPLFDSTSSDPLAAPFQQDFLNNHVATLAIDDINRFHYEPQDVFNSGQSVADPGSESDYDVHVDKGFKTQIDAQLAIIAPQPPLTADDIIARAKSLTCAGCHELSNGASLGGGLTFPNSNGFTHTSEFFSTGADGIDRFDLSPAVTQVFLPHRKQVLEDFLNNSCVAETDADFCLRLGAECGSLTDTDNCGSTRTVSNCGACSAPESCGGGGQSNTCGCTGESDAVLCANAGANCGSITVTDGCNVPRTIASCGACSSPQTCGGGGTPNVCGACVPVTTCGGQCGCVSDGCGGTLDCGPCPNPVCTSQKLFTCCDGITCSPIKGCPEMACDPAPGVCAVEM